MSNWFELDWHEMFVPARPLLEIVVRGSLMYLAMFFLLRLFRRQTGSLGPADLLVLLLVADAAQNGMAGEYKSITEGIVLIATIMGWEYLVDWLGFRSRAMRQILEHSPLLLIDHGNVLEGNLRREFITKEELIAHLRIKGLEHPGQTKWCYLESDGQISVVPFEPNDTARQSEKERQF